MEGREAPGEGAELALWETPPPAAHPAGQGGLARLRGVKVGCVDVCGVARGDGEVQQRSGMGGCVGGVVQQGSGMGCVWR